MAGRRPNPTALKIATGNPGKRRTNKREPIADGIPIPPDQLSDGARRAWFNLCPMLQSMGVIAKADGIAFERLCECYAEVNELQADLREGGRVQRVKIKDGTDVMERQRPQVAMLADADRRLKSYLVEFGLSPAARSKVNVAEQEEQSAAAGYFNG